MTYETLLVFLLRKIPKIISAPRKQFKYSLHQNFPTNSFLPVIGVQIAYWLLFLCTCYFGYFNFFAVCISFPCLVFSLGISFYFRSNPVAFDYSITQKGENATLVNNNIELVNLCLIMVQIESCHKIFFVYIIASSYEDKMIWFHIKNEQNTCSSFIV